MHVAESNPKSDCASSMPEGRASRERIPCKNVKLQMCEIGAVAG